MLAWPGFVLIHGMAENTDSQGSQQATNHLWPEMRGIEALSKSPINNKLHGYKNDNWDQENQNAKPVPDDKHVEISYWKLMFKLGQSRDVRGPQCRF